MMNPGEPMLGSWDSEGGAGESLAMLTKDIAAALGASLVGDGAKDIARIVHPDDAEHPSDLAVAIISDTAAALTRTRAEAAIVSAKRLPEPNRFASLIVIEQGRAALAILTALFDGGPARGAGVHQTAVVAPDIELGEGVSIGPFVVIGPGSRIGAGTTILSHASLGENVVVGAGGLIHSGVRIGDRVTIGERVMIHSNAVVGSDGFSFAPELGPRMPYSPGLELKRVHSLGRVIIGDDVEIGANTTIDRATLRSTRIGSGTKIDNQVQIGHNVTIGTNCLICGKVGISGSATIGDRVRIGGGAGIADHITIGTEAIIGAASGVGSDVREGQYVFGYPAVAIDRALEQYRYLRRQKLLHGKINEIATRVDELERDKMAR
jgi:UDP-3-O-[3-hydroxymyristoyl] glucosamine N-acyltransferase